MIPRLQSAGGSFMGAGKYYLHDKLAGQQADAARDGERVSTREQSDERVWFTDTRNCLNSDPERALEEMWVTAENQAWLKQQAGVKRGGRVCEDPVKTMSLAWHKDDAPTPEHMVEAADSFLKHMGWDQHQAVFVGHQDTEHRHIHIILNRVHPDTGRTLDDYRDQPRAQTWALAYEKQHEQIRCEMREVNAAKREGRTVEAESELSAHQHATPEREPAAARNPEPAQRQPANDHLPHNVIMIGRPHETAFKAQEQARADLDAAARDQLKAEQRAEREAFFKDGAKLFKATRHAVYDEVRKGYAAEWRQYYKDVKDAARMADVASQTALTRTAYFAAQGNWDQAREAFGDRDSFRDTVLAEFAERKADLKDRQTDDLREKQRDACDALREIREVQYKDLLQRQRDERAAFKAGQALDIVRPGLDVAQSHEGRTAHSGDAAANENRIAGGQPLTNAEVQAAPGRSGIEVPTIVIGEKGPAEAVAASLAPEAVAPSAEIAAPIPDSVTFTTPEAPEPTRQVADLAAGAIGSAANYLADQLGELFAPTPPEVREAEAKAIAKRDAEAGEREPPPRPVNTVVAEAVKALQQEQAEREASEWWQQRDRGKDFERDR